MKIARAMRMIRAINIVSSTDGGGLGLTAGEAGKWANVPYSSAHRYMAWLLKLRLVKRNLTQSKRQEYRYTLTSDGLELIYKQKEL